LPPALDPGRGDEAGEGTAPRPLRPRLDCVEHLDDAGAVAGRHPAEAHRGEGGVGHQGFELGPRRGERAFPELRGIPEAGGRHPFTRWGHTFKEEWRPKELADITVRRARRYRLDFVKLQPRATFFAEAYGSEYEPSGNGEEHPTLIRPGVETIEDWAELPEV